MLQFRSIPAGPRHHHQVGILVERLCSIQAEISVLLMKKVFEKQQLQMRYTAQKASGRSKKIGYDLRNSVWDLKSFFN